MFHSGPIVAMYRPTRTHKSAFARSPVASSVPSGQLFLTSLPPPNHCRTRQRKPSHSFDWLRSLPNRQESPARLPFQAAKSLSCSRPVTSGGRQHLHAHPSLQIEVRLTWRILSIWLRATGPSGRVSLKQSNDWVYVKLLVALIFLFRGSFCRRALIIKICLGERELFPQLFSFCTGRFFNFRKKKKSLSDANIAQPVTSSRH